MIRSSILAATIVAPLLGCMPSSAQEGTDPRALEACQASSASFVQIEKCLPQAHIAYKVLDAFSSTYPAAASPLRSRCTELNDQIAGVKACVWAAIESAISLAALLPKGSELEDPVFNAAKDPTMFDKLKVVEQRAAGIFPDLPIMSGAVMYYPYD